MVEKMLRHAIQVPDESFFYIRTEKVIRLVLRQVLFSRGASTRSGEPLIWSHGTSVKLGEKAS